MFSTSLTCITRDLLKGDFNAALQAASARAQHWSGGTTIGRCLRVFNEGYGRTLALNQVVVLILSDGWDCGDPGLLSQEMDRLSDRAWAVVWLNPLLKSPSYEPICQGMAAALPHVDFFLPIHNLDSVRGLSYVLQNLFTGSPRWVERSGVSGPVEPERYL